MCAIELRVWPRRRRFEQLSYSDFEDRLCNYLGIRFTYLEWVQSARSDSTAFLMIASVPWNYAARRGSMISLIARQTSL
jgi:hypothetical protein